MGHVLRAPLLRKSMRDALQPRKPHSKHLRHQLAYMLPENTAPTRPACTRVGVRQGLPAGLAPQCVRYCSRCATAFPMAMQLVRPGDSMPNRWTSPATPCVLAS